MDEITQAQDELKYLTWLAIRNGIKPKRRVVETRYGFSIEISLYENLMKEIAEEFFPRYRYKFARMLPARSNTPRNSFIPLTKKYPLEVISDCEPFLIEILPLSEVKEWKNKSWNY
jgi:hypothetical protein